MALPTRDELIKRWVEHPGFALPDIADFALAEIRRAVAEELEALRRKTCNRVVEEGDAQSRGVNMHVDFVRRSIDDCLAVLREQTKVGEFAGIPIMADPSVKPWTIEARAGNVAAPALPYSVRFDVNGQAVAIQRDGSDVLHLVGGSWIHTHENVNDAERNSPQEIVDMLNRTDKPGAESQAQRPATTSERAEGRTASSPCPPPALTDADVLERAAEILRKSDIKVAQDAATVCEFRAGGLRAASAPKPVDVFEAFASGYFNGVPSPNLAERARAVFSPLVAALKKARHALGSTDTAVHDAAIDEIDDALSALRQHAQEASR